MGESYDFGGTLKIGQAPPQLKLGLGINIDLETIDKAIYSRSEEDKRYLSKDAVFTSFHEVNGNGPNFAFI